MFCRSEIWTYLNGFSQCQELQNTFFRAEPDLGPAPFRTSLSPWGIPSVGFSVDYRLSLAHHT